jgi:glyoxylase-like metal-dependent hydrolase (beta-lactamase superfamily II)
LRDGDSIVVGDVQLVVLETPGHAAGHISFEMVHGGRKHLFSGDAIFAGGHILLLNFPDCSLQQALASVRRLDGRAVDVLLPGHASIALHQGQDHIDAALAIMARCAVPPDVPL